MRESVAIHCPDDVGSEHLLANPFYIQAPPYQRSFSWGEQEAGKLLEDITSVPSLDAGGDNGVYFLGAMLFIEREPAPAALAPEALAAPADAQPRGRGRPAEADDAHHPAVHPARPRPGAAQYPRAGRDRRRAGSQAAPAPVDRRARRGLLPQARARSRRHPPPPRAYRPLAVAAAHRRRARPPRRGADGLRPGRPPQARASSCSNGAASCRWSRPTSIRHTGCSRCSMPEASRWRATTSSRPSCSAACRKPRVRQSRLCGTRPRRAPTAISSSSSPTSAPCTDCPKAR